MLRGGWAGGSGICTPRGGPREGSLAAPAQPRGAMGRGAETGGWTRWKAQREGKMGAVRGRRPRSPAGTHLAQLRF